MKGTIETRPRTPLTNELVIKYRWIEKDYTDTDRCFKEYPIHMSEWHLLINKGLLNREVRFEVTTIDDKEYARVIFPPVTYSEDETKALAVKAWNEGYSVCSAQSGYNGIFMDFWNQNKKK